MDDSRTNMRQRGEVAPHSLSPIGGSLTSGSKKERERGARMSEAGMLC